MADRCPITELLSAECAHCKGVDLPRDEQPERGPWFPARYIGLCSACGWEFSLGEKIRADGRGGYLADCCGDDDD